MGSHDRRATPRRAARACYRASPLGAPRTRGLARYRWRRVYYNSDDATMRATTRFRLTLISSRRRRAVSSPDIFQSAATATRHDEWASRRHATPGEAEQSMRIDTVSLAACRYAAAFYNLTYYRVRQNAAAANIAEVTLFSYRLFRLPQFRHATQHHRLLMTRHASLLAAMPHLKASAASRALLLEIVHSRHIARIA